MKRPSVLVRIVSVVLAVLMLGVSAALVWAVIFDYESRVFITKGVEVAGTSLTGMTVSQASDAVEGAVSTPMMRPITVTGEKKSWTLDPSNIVAVDVESMVDKAYAPRRNATLVQRLRSELASEPLPATIAPEYSVDAAAVKSWVGDTAKDVNRRPIDATRRVAGYHFKFTPSKLGAEVDQSLAVKRIAAELSAEAALNDTTRVVMLPVRKLTPKVTEDKLGKAIIVSLPECEIRYYEGTKLVKSYPCAPGRPGFPTPTGDFVVDSKLYMEPWYNPGTDWAKTMPPMIPAGPYNPMGIHKIGINYAGVFMHGIPPGEFDSIGTHASHGCMRMFPSDVKDLFGRVELGMPVYIRG